MSGFGRTAASGFAPTGELLFLACPSKSNQKERHPVARSRFTRFPSMLVCNGRCATRAMLRILMRSNSARYNPVTYCASRLRQRDISTLNFGAMIMTATDPKQPY